MTNSELANRGTLSEKSYGNPVPSLKNFEEGQTIIS